MLARTPTLEDLVARARAHKMTPNERRMQRVSLIMGLKDKNSSLTREQVEELLDEHEGHSTAVTGKR
ncbi:hypothetical protein MWN34_08160 [Ancylobacter sp. 6x-1]|uniref:Uncharacterized protein n=1 Tax=Ancylobacter crimeensis TaxID=2579147 RepID=A0ABT0DAA4_9HYPH|nr:hypothetical protein [Ancylobacter crimeensis]MCK0196886.1 hypothetical protein [Ancylobacter crimeensis]